MGCGGASRTVVRCVGLAFLRFVPLWVSGALHYFQPVPRGDRKLYLRGQVSTKPSSCSIGPIAVHLIKFSPCTCAASLSCRRCGSSPPWDRIMMTLCARSSLRRHRGPTSRRTRCPSCSSIVLEGWARVAEFVQRRAEASSAAMQGWACNVGPQVAQSGHLRSNSKTLILDP